MTKTATIYLTSDPTQLGPNANHDDLNRYAENLRRGAIERFALDECVVNIGSVSRSDSDHDAVREWIRDLESGDGWLQYLETTTTTTTTYTIIASRNGEDVSSAETIGDSYGIHYDRAVAEIEMSALRADASDPDDLCHGIEYALVEHQHTISVGSVDAVHWPLDDDGNEDSSALLDYTCSVPVIVDGKVYYYGIVVGAPESTHSEIRAAGCGVRPYLRVEFDVDGRPQTEPDYLAEEILGALRDEGERLFAECEDYAEIPSQAMTGT